MNMEDCAITAGTCVVQVGTCIETFGTGVLKTGTGVVNVGTCMVKIDTDVVNVSMFVLHVGTRMEILEHVPKFGTDVNFGRCVLDFGTGVELVMGHVIKVTICVNKLFEWVRFCLLT